MHPTHFYQLKRPALPWGDYGDVLAHGRASASNNAASLELERTGPFVPPLSQPLGHVVVTDSFLQSLRESGLSGFEAHPVVKRKITKVDWQTWKPHGHKAMTYPAGGEPENYIDGGPYSAAAALELGELWWIKFRLGIHVTRDGGYQLLGDTWNGADFSVVDQESCRFIHYVSQRARDWLMKHIPEWVAFAEERVRWVSTPPK